MAWTWIRPADPSVLEPRPLLDLGTGDGQTLLALASGDGTFGLDRSLPPLRALRRRTGLPVVCAEAARPPFRTRSFATVLAADLVHHLGSDELADVLGAVREVLFPDGRLVAWWYGASGRPGPDAPRYPRSYEDVSEAARAAGFGGTERLELRASLDPAPPTVGMLARR